MKKNYETEYSSLSDVKKVRERLSLTLEESRAKLRALEKGMSDLERHYKAGLIIPEDYTRQFLEVKNEISELREAIKGYQRELRLSRLPQARSDQNKSGKGFFESLFSLGQKIKGTKELADEEDKQLKLDKLKRKKIIIQKKGWPVNKK